MKRILIFVLFSGYVLYHLITLTISPLPWFDEVIFTSISHSFATTGNLFCTVAPFIADKQVVVYGPVYFAITGMFEKIFGFGIFQFRIVALISGFFVAGLFYFFLKKHFSEFKKYQLLFLLLFILDPIFNASMHGGRMDLLASVFMLGSFFLLLKMKEQEVKQNTKLIAVASAFFASIAVLTTPRIGILLISFAAIFLFRFIKNSSKKNLYETTIWVVVFSVPLLLWILLAFDGNQLQMNNYNPFGGNFFYPGEFHKYPKALIPLLILFVLSIFIGIAAKGKKYFKEIIVLSIVNIISFFTLIFETGGYYVLVIPFFYFLIFEMSTFLTHRFQVVNKSMLILFLLFNVAVFIVKGINTGILGKQRSSHEVNNFVSKHVPRGSKVIGDELLYHPVILSGSDFQLINWYQNTKLREVYQREVYDYDYILVSEHLYTYRKNIVDYYMKKSELEFVIQYTFADEKKGINFPSKFNAPESYSCYLFKRIKN